MLFRSENLDYSLGAPGIFLVSDACMTGGSGVICQGKDLKTVHVIAFWSGKFNAAQQNYPVHDIEMLAIIESLKRFRTLLLGAKFKILTDHRALQYFMTQKKLSARQSRWLETLSEFDFTIEYIPGSTNILADALSRIYSADEPGTVRAESEFVPPDEEEVEASSIRAAMTAITRPVRTGEQVFAALDSIPKVPVNEISVAAAAPKTKGKKKPVKALPKVILRVRNTETGEIYTPGSKMEGVSLQDVGDPKATEKSPNETKDAPMEALRAPGGEEITATSTKSALDGATATVAASETNNVIQLPSPDEELLANLAPRLMEIISQGDPSVDLPESLKNRYSEDPFFKLVLAEPGHYKNFELANGLIFLRDSEKRILCVPDVLIGGRSARDIVITHAHSILAHLGPRKTLYYLKDNVWWKTMVEDVKSFCDSCSTCKTSKSNTQAPYGLLHPLPVPSRPWQSIGIDFVGPLTRKDDGRSQMLKSIIQLWT